MFSLFFSSFFIFFLSSFLVAEFADDGASANFAFSGIKRKTPAKIKADRTIRLFSFFGKETAMLLSYLRTIVLYLILIAVIRVMGKRQIGQMEPTEFVVTMLVANLAAIPMQDGGIPLYSGLVPIVTVLGVELVLSYLSLRSVRFRRLLCGKPVILMENGKILQENLRQTRITLDELTSLLREKEVLDYQTVQYAILETSGNLSVFLYPKYLPATAKDAGVPASPQKLPYTIIADGYLFRDNLQLAGKDMHWLEKTLCGCGGDIASTLLLTVDGSDHVRWQGKER